MIDNYCDLLVQSKFKNAILWKLMNGKTASQCSREIGICNTQFGNLLNLKMSPFSSRSVLEGTSQPQYRPVAIKISNHYGVLAEELFPASLYSLTLPDKVERLYSSVELVPLMEASLLEFDPDKSPELLAEKNEMLEIVRELLKKIEPARAQMLKWRFGLDGSPPLTLEECARKWGVTPQCVQVKEKVALRDIRTFIRKKNLAASMLSTKKQHWISGRAIDDVMSEGKRKKEAAAALWKIRKLRGNLLPQTIGGAEGKDGNA